MLAGALSSPTENVCRFARRSEICFRGYSLMLGYYNDPAATAKAIDGDGWLHTGDRGLLRPTGELEYFGRIKDMLRVGGENLAPAEVEEVLSQHPKVRQSAVVGIPDVEFGQRLKAAERAGADPALDRESGAPANIQVYPVVASHRIGAFLAVAKDTGEFSDYDRIILHHVVTVTALELVKKKAVAEFADLLKQERPILQKQGIEVITLSPAESEKFLKTAYEAGWKELSEKAPQATPELRRLLTKK